MCVCVFFFYCGSFLFFYPYLWFYVPIYFSVIHPFFVHFRFDLLMFILICLNHFPFIDELVLAFAHLSLLFFHFYMSNIFHLFLVSLIFYCFLQFLLTFIVNVITLTGKHFSSRTVDRDTNTVSLAEGHLAYQTS